MKDKKIKLDLKSIENEVSISDGYHTFDELYDHRITLYIALCKSLKNGNVWRSQIHSDGSNYEGWFLLGVFFQKGMQITYHIPNERWIETEFADTLKIAPEFDGHTSMDVLERIKRL